MTMNERHEPMEQAQASEPVAEAVAEPVPVASEVATPEEVQPPPLGPADEVEALRQEIEHLKQLSEEYLDQARRARAEFLNYKRRVEQELEEFKHLAHMELIAKLLPVLDDFHLAIAPPAAGRRRFPLGAGAAPDRAQALERAGSRGGSADRGGRQAVLARGA
jgi:molecular chaperone GrpE